MKCFIDTNILISAGLFPQSVPSAALIKALSPPYEAIICDYSVDEMLRVTKRKFPDKRYELETFLARILLVVQIIKTPIFAEEAELEIRDIKDRPILRAAIKAGADLLITGDKDFLESTITNPRIMKAADFVSDSDIALYDQAKAEDNGERISSADLRAKYQI